MADETVQHKTVSELIAELQAMPPDMPVAISIDAEGNQYKYLDEVTAQAFENQASQMLLRIFKGESNDDDAPADTVVIWPVN